MGAGYSVPGFMEIETCWHLFQAAAQVPITTNSMARNARDH
jgi:hypothetical protein